MRLGRRLSSGIAADPPASREDTAPSRADAPAPEPRREPSAAGRTSASPVPAER